MESAVRLFQGADQRIFGVQLLVAVGVLIQFKYRAGEEAQESILLIALYRGRFIHRLGLMELHPSTDQGIIHADFDCLAVHADINMVFLRAHRIERGSGNFLYNPVAVRDILKGKAAVLAGGYGKQRVFFGKFLGIRRKQAHHRAGQFHILAAVRALAIFHAVNAPAEQVIGNSLAVIYQDRDKSGLLARILKDYRVFGIGKHIGAVCGALLHIIAAKRQIGIKASVIAARLICGNGDHFQKPACRDHAAIRRRQVSGSIQTKGNVLVFLIHAKPEKLVCFQGFEQGHIHLLALVIQPHGGLRHFHGLARVGQLRIFRGGI